jgi:hypothetical protein
VNTPGADFQRRETGIAGAPDVRADRVERIHQVADRAFMHPRHAGEPVVSARERERRRERAKSRSRIAQEQIRLAGGKHAAATCHGEVPGSVPAAHHDAELQQSVDHPVHVVRCQEIADVRRAGRQCGQQQRAVGDALIRAADGSCAR